jgi:subtilase family serine protease
MTHLLTGLKPLRRLPWPRPAAGGGSNSWSYSSGEFSGETGDDQYFTTAGVVYFASFGDSGWGPAYPSTSPNVVSAGGTSIIRDASGNFTGQEDCSCFSGGGRSQYEQAPRYQWIITNLAGPFRDTPDLAADADPQSGVDVYSSTYCTGWCIVGGTSVASPVLAGIVNESGSFHTSTSAELMQAYNEYGIGVGTYNKYFRDIGIGSNGYSSTLGWDQCTGLGSPKTPSGL